MRPTNAVTLMLLVSLTGCASLGPRTIRNARFDYNEAIVRTWNEQMLLNLVRLRYRDTPLFLEVSGVSTQYTFLGSALASAEVNPGSADAYGAGLGVEYTESPTISYSPLQGEKFATQLLSPISLETLVLLSGSGWRMDRVLRSCVQRMNGLYNAPRASGPTPEDAPEYRDFLRATRMLLRLQRARALEFQVDEEGETRRTTLRFLPDSGLDEEVRELKRLLELEEKRDEFRVVQGLGGGRGDRIALTTRSLLSVLFYLSHAVEPPAHDVDAGVVTVTRDGSGEPFDWQRLAGGLFRVRSSENRPDRAFARVFYRGSWFYIDDADLDTKSSFGLLAQLFNLQAGQDPRGAPLLTLPVGR